MKTGVLNSIVPGPVLALADIAHADIIKPLATGGHDSGSTPCRNMRHHLADSAATLTHTATPRGNPVSCAEKDSQKHVAVTGWRRWP